MNINNIVYPSLYNDMTHNDTDTESDTMSDTISDVVTTTSIVSVDNKTEVSEDTCKKIFIFEYPKKYSTIVVGVGALTAYMLLGHILSVLYHVFEYIVFAIMPFKIAVHVFSNRTECLDHESSTDQVQVTHEDRSNYMGLLLRQSLVVTVVRSLMILVAVLNTVPIVGTISHITYMSLLLLAICVQTPTTIMNRITVPVTKKIRFIKLDLHLERPLSEKLISMCSSRMTPLRLKSLNEIDNIMIKYDSNGKYSRKDKNRLLTALNSLDIGSLKYFKSLQNFLPIKRLLDVLYSVNGYLE